MAEIKILLGKKKREVKAVGTNKESRTGTFGYIIFADPKQFILSECELVTEPSDDTVEIDGELFKKGSGGADTFHSSIPHAVDSYLEKHVIKSPKKDVTALMGAVELYEDARKELKRLLTLHPRH